jgi:hypothetical protein
MPWTSDWLLSACRRDSRIDAGNYVPKLRDGHIDGAGRTAIPVAGVNPAAKAPYTDGRHDRLLITRYAADSAGQTPRDQRKSQVRRVRQDSNLRPAA